MTEGESQHILDRIEKPFKIVRTMIRSIIFDFGNVICTFDNGFFLRKLLQSTDKKIPELNEIIYRSGLAQRYETGLISSDEFFNEVVGKGNLVISKADFIKAYTDIFSPIETTVNLIVKVSTTYTIALLSNTSEWDFEYRIKSMKIFPLFHAMSLSFLVGAMKPDRRIFLDMLIKLNSKPEECVYIDDIPQYVEVARKIGMHAIHYVGYDNLVNSLAELSISV